MRRPLTLLPVALLITALLAGPAHASNDPFRNKQWGLDKIQAEQAWTTSDGTGAVIAVVDTGVDLGHPDLAANIASSGADFSDNKDTDGAQDEHGHGSHVAGIAAAVANNGEGVASVAPGAKILPVRVLDENGSGSTDDVAAGIVYATDNGADVINLSLGVVSGIDKIAKLIGALDPIYDAIDYAHSKGVVVVAAAGNDAVPLCSEPSGHPDVVCVGATDVRDLRTFYSNNDATMTQHYLVAPGGDALTCSGDIFSTVLRGIDTFCGPDGYDAYAGTSMATPHVAGVSALLAAKGLGREAIITCLTTTADDLGLPGRDPVYGYGRVDALNAVTTC